MTTFNLAEQFTKCCGGRHRDHGPHSGEELREDHLVPLLESTEGPVTIQLDGVMGMPPSFSEEAFGGLVRKLGAGVLLRVSFEGYGADEVRQFMVDQADRDYRAAHPPTAGDHGELADLRLCRFCAYRATGITLAAFMKDDVEADRCPECKRSGFKLWNEHGYRDPNDALKYKAPGRNDPCFCGSGKKYKRCCRKRHNPGCCCLRPRPPGMVHECRCGCIQLSSE